MSKTIKFNIKLSVAGKEFYQQLHAHPNEVGRTVHRTLPIKVGRATKNFYQAGFRKGSFTNGGFRP